MIDHKTIDEVAYTIENISVLFQNFCVGGLHTTDSKSIKTLTVFKEEFSRIGASHITIQLQELIDAILDNKSNAPMLLMRVQASIRLFERLLTLEVLEQSLMKNAEETN